MTEAGGSGPVSPMKVRLLAAAEADLSRLERSVARRAVECLRWLAEHAGEDRHAALSGDLKGLFKLRLGDWRILYELVKRERTILVHAVGNRRDIYQQARKRL